MTRQQSGFTLMELLIAVLIFSLISTAAYRLLTSVTHSQRATEVVLQQLSQWQRLRLVLEKDFSQLVQRPVRDQYGDREPFLVTPMTEPYWVVLTRTGWRNPLSYERSHLQRVAYQLEDGQLIRLYWPELDRAPDTQPIRQTVMKGIIRFDLRFLDPQQQWHTDWPPLDASTGRPETSSPAAVEFTLEHQQYGRRQFLLAVPGVHAHASGGSGV